MSKVMLSEEVIEGDVLCVGGGIAGMMAAIRAGELGADVIVAEKANTLRSGCGATGNDHFRCYMPEFHGPSIEPIIALIKAGPGGVGRSDAVIRAGMELSYDMVKLWDSWGIPMKYNGKWEFAGHAIPGLPFISMLHYAGRDQKPILTREARKRGARIVNRVMVFELLYDNGVIGALGIDTREDKLVVFRVKSIILATGLCARLYSSPTPGWMFNRADSPHTTGDGRAMAYRAGAELMNMELIHRWAGPKYYSRCGKGTWIGVLRDSQGKAVGPFLSKPDRKYGDPISNTYTGAFEDYWKNGKGPVFMDCGGISEDDYQYMTYFLENEGNGGLLAHLREEGVDIRNNPIEFMTYEMTTRGGVYFNEKGETSAAGLFAAGDEYFGGIPYAATYGWITGENATGYAKQSDAPGAQAGRALIEEKKALLEDIRNKQVGAGWKEVNIALNQVMVDYAGTVRSDTLLETGYDHLKRLKAKAYQALIAGNAHELMHCMEVLNLFDIAELVFLSVMKRQETREKYTRIDYPYRNPVLDGKNLICRKGDSGAVAEWRKIE